MHPEPPAIPEHAQSDTAPQQPEPSSQHGIHHARLDPAVSPSSADETNPGPSSAAPDLADQRALDAAIAASLQESAAANQPRGDGRLNTRKTPSPPARNRVAEYEQASTPPVRRPEGPAFEVTKKQRSPGDKRSFIQELPNEVLTHTLAHLGPNDLTSASFVSKRFHNLVTGPHAWRTAFSHYFPGPDSVNAGLHDETYVEQTIIRSDKRAFTRLTALASWRSEYIMRTRLLRSLSRGKPAQFAPAAHATGSGNASTIAPTVRYESKLFNIINHIHATFGTGLNKRLPRFIHGADDVSIATSSDPSAAKVDAWGLSDPQSFLQFTDRYPGDAQYGLGSGEIVGVPNSMDVSQPYGMIVGEGSPGGMTYYRSTEELRGRYLLLSSGMSNPELGIPRIMSSTEAITAVWIAKSSAIPSLTEGLIGMLSGSSLGVLNAYSLGLTVGGNVRDQRFVRGEMTARWVLSPGVPIIALAVDSEHSLKRQAQNRIWAVALNALGEVFYLTKFPKRPHMERGSRLDDESLERTAWLAGRTVYWNTVEPSRREAKSDPYADATLDGSYSPRSSWNGMCLSKSQIEAETREVEAYAVRKPKEFQRNCIGWDMRRKLDVDFAGDDGNNAGENVIVYDCGLEENDVAAVKRYSRTRFQENSSIDAVSTPPLTNASTEPASPPSLFGAASPILVPTPSFSYERLEDSLAQDDFTGSITPRPMTEEWRTTMFSFNGLKHVQILATAIDNSTFAVLTTSEDPLLSFSGRSAASSPSLTPLSSSEPIVDPADLPGQRARFCAVGTGLGTVLLWNMRAPISRNVEVVNTIEPVRVIHTDSPEISCLALSSLFLIHGGNDGLVQMWDVLGSDMAPIRTLHSRFTSRARRRLVQAQASPQGVGINLFAAGAICLDTDPTVLRGIVSLGTYLLYWSYSSSAADQYKSTKRRLRRSERGSNNGGERFSGATRSNLKDYIANERFELDREKEQRRKDSQRFAGRFGTDLLGGSEEEMMAYAALLSQESLEQETLRRGSDTSTVASNSADLTPAQTPSPRRSEPKTDEELDADIAEAIRQSLATSPSNNYTIPIRRAKTKSRKTPSAKTSPRGSPLLASSSSANEISDFEFAMQLSLAEEQSKHLDQDEEFPGLSAARGSVWKGKRRM